MPITNTQSRVPPDLKLSRNAALEAMHLMDIMNQLLSAVSKSKHEPVVESELRCADFIVVGLAGFLQDMLNGSSLCEVCQHGQNRQR